MRSMRLLSAIGEINDELIYSAKKTIERTTAHSVSGKNHFFVLAAFVALLSLCGFVAYQIGLFDPWYQKPSVMPVETVQSAIKGQLEKDYAITVQILEIKTDNAATKRAKKMYQGSDLAKKNNWSDKYIENNMIVVFAEYYVEYNHEKTFQPDGKIRQFFILLRNEETQKWEIWDNTTNGDPFFQGGDADK